MKLFCLIINTSLALLFTGCTAHKASLREHKGSYLESVKLNFEAGEEMLKKSEYDKAIAYFQFVRSKYPFSKYAALSDLKIADTKFAQKKWLDAASAYEIFMRLHPRNEEVAYASYRLGVSYFYAVPSAFFLSPSSSSRDQSFTKEALLAIERFLIQFPGSEHVGDALAKRAELFSKLAQHNQQIAGYYERRGKFKAAAERYLSVHELYPEALEAPESLYKAGRIVAYKLKNSDAAIEIFEKIIENFPESYYASKARAELDLIQKSNAE